MQRFNRQVDSYIALALGWESTVQKSNGEYFGIPPGATEEFRKGLRSSLYDPLPHFSSDRVDLKPVLAYLRKNLIGQCEVFDGGDDFISTIKVIDPDGEISHLVESQTFEMAHCILALEVAERKREQSKRHNLSFTHILRWKDKMVDWANKKSPFSTHIRI